MSPKSYHQPALKSPSSLYSPADQPTPSLLLLVPKYCFLPHLGISPPPTKPNLTFETMIPPHRTFPKSFQPCSRHLLINLVLFRKIFVTHLLPIVFSICFASLAIPKPPMKATTPSTSYKPGAIVQGFIHSICFPFTCNLLPYFLPS